MKRTCIPLILCAATAGCASDHIDIRSSYRLTGVIQASSAEPASATRNARLTFRDLALDDTRRPEQRIIASRDLPLGEPFDFVEDYFWGITVSDIDEIPAVDDDLVIEIGLEGCRPWRMTFSTSALPLEDGTLRIPLGKVFLDC